MKLLVKFNLLFILAFGLGLAATGYVARQFLQENARDQVLQQARLMMELTSSMRTYTSAQVRPLLEVREKKEQAFYPQTVPAYAAGQVFADLRGRYPQYTYREATLNPTNLADRATDWEADVVNGFRNDSTKKEIVGQREAGTGASLFLAKPIRATPACMECHSVARAAPVPMLKAYGRDHGFGWKPVETVAAQIVSVPLAVPAQIADRAFRNLMLSLTIISLATILLLNIALVVTVIRPVARMSAAAEAISTGNLDVPELRVRGTDEIATLASAFNRMQRSLVKAMALLE